MDEDLNQLLRDIRKRFHDAKIFLFGSRAKGNATQDSDYDLIVISKKFEKTPFVNRAGEIWLHTDAALAADMLCYTPEEFARQSKISIVLKDAMKHAVPL